MKKLSVAMSLAAAVAAPSVFADSLGYKPGQWVVRAGATQVEPREDSDRGKIPAKFTWALQRHGHN